MHHFLSRIAESTTSTGTGNITLAGALSGCRSFSAAGAVVGLLFGYTIEAVDANGIPNGDWECGIGEISATNTLSRRFVVASSNSNGAVDFGSGTKYVYLSPLAELSNFGLAGHSFIHWQTDFLGPPGAGTVESASSIWDLVLISSGTQGAIAGNANHPGILRLSSSTTANSGAILSTYGTTTGNAIQFLIGGGEYSSFILRPQTLTNTTIRAGHIDTGSSGDATDGVYFEIVAGEVVGKCSSNSARTSTSTLATLSTNTWYRLMYAVNYNATSVWFGVFDENGSLLGSGTVTTNIPTAAGRQCGHGLIATNSGTTASNLVEIDYMNLGIARPLTR